MDRYSAPAQQCVAVYRVKQRQSRSHASRAWRACLICAMWCRRRVWPWLRTGELIGKQIDLRIHDRPAVLVHGIHDVLQALVVGAAQRLCIFSCRRARRGKEVQRNASGAAPSQSRTKDPGIPVRTTGAYLGAVWADCARAIRAARRGTWPPIACAAAELHGGECTIETDSESVACTSRCAYRLRQTRTIGANPVGGY